MPSNPTPETLKVTDSLFNFTYNPVDFGSSQSRTISVALIEIENMYEKWFPRSSNYSTTEEMITMNKHIEKASFVLPVGVPGTIVKFWEALLDANLPLACR